MKSRSAEIRAYLIEHTPAHPQDIARLTADHFGISRQAVNRHITTLIADGLMSGEGSTRRRSYRLASTGRNDISVRLAGLEEDVVWRRLVRPLLADLPGNALDLWHYGFTEMLNNAIDHAEGECAQIEVTRTARDTEISICDDGIGIFRKIRRELGLDDEHHAILELAKGKLTTAPKRHAGEGIFFTSRMFDRFELRSGGLRYLHDAAAAVADTLSDVEAPLAGTRVVLRLSNATPRTDRAVFDQYASSADDFGFTRTVVPVRLAQYGDEQLVSRSQARRLLARFERFRSVVLDFSGVRGIGQAFADEVFRVFPLHHPETAISAVNTLESVAAMIARVGPAGS